MDEKVKEKGKILKCSLAAYIILMLFMILCEIISLWTCCALWDVNRVAAKTSMLFCSMMVFPFTQMIIKVSGRWWLALINDVAFLSPWIITLIILY